MFSLPSLNDRKLLIISKISRLSIQFRLECVPVLVPAGLFADFKESVAPGLNRPENWSRPFGLRDNGQKGSDCFIEIP